MLGAIRSSLPVKLVLAFVLPTVVLFSVFAFVAHEVQRKALEEELGRRLEAVAASASTRLRGKYLVDLQEGDEEGPYYQGGQKRLEQVALATGVERLYVFDREFHTKLDTGAAPISSLQFQAEIDRREVGEVFDKGVAKSSLLFDGVDGRPYKAAYAPVYRSDDEPEVVLAIGADAPADFFKRLARLRRQLVLYGLLLVTAVAAIAIFVALRITGPMRRLAEAARRIGAGELDKEVPVVAHDEIGTLGRTMEQMRADLRARDERMQLMLAGIAHEVRNPLGGIELFSGILREELEDDEEKRGHVERIERELGYLKKVVESFLEYARRPVPELLPLRLDELVNEVVELERAEIEAAGLRVDASLEEVSCLGDKGQLRRVVLNLVRNAMQAAKGSDSALEIETRKIGEVVRLSVRNQGEPISDEARERLFEPFFTTKQKGTGLGLAFVKEIVDDHRAIIAVESDVERGTCFALEFPAARDDNSGRGGAASSHKEEEQ